MSYVKCQKEALMNKIFYPLHPAFHPNVSKSPHLFIIKPPSHCRLHFHCIALNCKSTEWKWKVECRLHRNSRLRLPQVYRASNDRYDRCLPKKDQYRKTGSVQLHKLANLMARCSPRIAITTSNIYMLLAAAISRTLSQVE